MQIVNAPQGRRSPYSHSQCHYIQEGKGILQSTGSNLSSHTSWHRGEQIHNIQDTIIGSSPLLCSYILAIAWAGFTTMAFR